MLFRSGGDLDLLGSYHIDEDKDSYYFKFTKGWGEFVVQTRMHIDDLIVVQVKATRDYIRLIVEVITDNADDDAEEHDEGSELDSVGENF